ncbi:MAG: hypothetical protein RLY97_696 [Pseudomonadota bacterium]|jgi:1-acyl-sn-glycerol-3-phosphate acyltransferase
MALVLRNFGFYLAFYLGSVVYVLGALLALPFSARHFRHFSEGWSAYHARCARVFLGIEVRIEGEMPSGAVLFACKHESFFEAINLPHLLNHPGVFAKAELLRIPLWGLVGARFGLIGVERDQGAKALRSMVAAARQISDAGRPLAIFPEGTRVAHGVNAPLQSGFAGLYRLIGLPVVPVATNSGVLYHRRLKRSGVIVIRFGAVIPVGLTRDAIEARVRAEINGLGG